MYLERVDDEGRGKNQTLTHHFRAADDPDPSLVNLLLQYGFTRRSVKENAIMYAPFIEEAVQFLERKLQQGATVRNRPGLIVDFLKNRYVREGSPSTQMLAEAFTGSVGLQSVLESTGEAENQLEIENQRLFALTPEQQFQEAEKTFKMLMYKLLSKKEQDALTLACTGDSAGQ